MPADDHVPDLPPRRRKSGGAREAGVDEAARRALAESLHQAGVPWTPGQPLRRDELIEHLHALQDRHGQLRADHLAALAEAHRLALAEVHEVASFYHHFDIVHEAAEGGWPAAPRVTVRVCDGLTCQMAGATALLERLRSVLQADVRVLGVPCIGRCDRAPAASVQRHGLAPATVEAVVKAAQAAPVPPPGPPASALGLGGCLAAGGYRQWAQAVAGALSAESLIGELEAAGLRGMGGAGFPAARKWRLVRAAPAPKWLAVNLDEGEPGTFKDRVLLEADPHRMLEGALLAAWAVGAGQVVLYLRDEYAELHALLKRELERLRAHGREQGWPLPELVLRRGAGAYVCGEESAMLESIEGRRGMPRQRPPYVAERGLFGRPTLVHNGETLFWLRELAERGGAWFAAQGRHGRSGLRRYSVSGRVRKPGVKLAPAGITLRELIEEFCGGMADGHRLYGFLPGGASGGLFPDALADEPLDFGTLQPHGGFIGSAAVVVLSDADRAIDAARALLAFFEHESCGQCTPCRAGTRHLRELTAAAAWDAALIGELAQVMRDASICGLGQAAPNPVTCVLRHFPHELAPAGGEADAGAPR